jgi:hypothetical protein
MIRRPDKLTATEIHFARSQATQDNIPLNDTQIREVQLNTRHPKQLKITFSQVIQSNPTQNQNTIQEKCFKSQILQTTLSESKKWQIQQHLYSLDQNPIQQHRKVYT